MASTSRSMSMVVVESCFICLKEKCKSLYSFK